MKRFPYLLCCAAVFAACNQPAPKTANTDTLPAASTAADTVAVADTGTDDTTVLKIRQSLQTILKADLNAADSADRQFSHSETDLNGDGIAEIFVGLKGSYYCGNAGCTALLLSSDGKLLTQFTLVRTPIHVLDSKTKGWKDLVISTKGGSHLMRWNGAKYPGNPSMQPAYETTMQPGAVTVLGEDKWFSF